MVLKLVESVPITRGQFFQLQTYDPNDVIEFVVSKSRPEAIVAYVEQSIEAYLRIPRVSLEIFRPQRAVYWMFVLIETLSYTGTTFTQLVKKRIDAYTYIERGVRTPRI